MRVSRLEYDCQNQSEQKRKRSCFITYNLLIKHKTGLLSLAEELGNISQAYKIMGMSSDTFYRYQQAAEQGGVEALFNQNQRVPNLKNRIDGKVEQAVVQFALDNSAFG